MVFHAWLPPHMIDNGPCIVARDGRLGRLTDDEPSKHRLAAVSIPLAVFFRCIAEESVHHDVVALLLIDERGPLFLLRLFDLAANCSL